jgi:uncharacterized phage protein (TIGR02218 family)
MATYLSRPVWEWPIDWSSQPKGRFSYDLREIALGYGPESYYSPQDHIVNGYRFDIVLDTDADIAAMDTFFDALVGRLVGFWLPTPDVAFEIVAGVAADKCDIVAAGLPDGLTTYPEFHVWLTRDGYTSQAAKLSAASTNPDGTERITFSAALAEAPNQHWKAVRLQYVRLADDREDGKFDAEGRLSRKIAVVELPSEYASLETGETLVYLYHFSVEAGAETLHWHWTSFHEETESGGSTYTPRAITHTGFIRSLRAEAERVTLEGKYEADSPLASLVGRAFMRPLQVTIYSATLANIEDRTTLFTGSIMNCDVQGLKIAAEASSVLDIYDQQICAHMLQPRCNYQLYKAGTCKLDENDFSVAADVEEVAEREVTVSGAELESLDEDWFTGGWIRSGSGATYEERGILASSGETAGEITLVLMTAPVHIHAGNAVTLLPGCDGTESDCTSKFDNFANWGGFRYSPKNLTFKAVKLDAQAGGKK